MSAIRLDLGLPRYSTSFGRSNGRFIAKKNSAQDEVIATLQSRVLRLESRSSSTMAPALPMLNDTEVFIQNNTSMVVHQLRDLQSRVTRCGWNADSQLSAGRALIRECIADTPFWLVCEKCMPLIRQSMVVTVPCLTNLYKSIASSSPEPVANNGTIGSPP